MHARDVVFRRMVPRIEAQQGDVGKESCRDASAEQSLGVAPHGQFHHPAGALHGQRPRCTAVSHVHPDRATRLSNGMHQPSRRARRTPFHVPCSQVEQSERALVTVADRVDNQDRQNPIPVLGLEIRDPGSAAHETELLAIEEDHPQRVVQRQRLQLRRSRQDDRATGRVVDRPRRADDAVVVGGEDDLALQAAFSDRLDVDDALLSRKAPLRHRPAQSAELFAQDGGGFGLGLATRRTCTERSQPTDKISRRATAALLAEEWSDPRQQDRATQSRQGPHDCAATGSTKSPVTFGASDQMSSSR